MTSIPKYKDLKAALETVDSSFHPAEAHGFIAGLLVASHGMAQFDLKSLQIPENDTNIKQILNDLFLYTQAHFLEFSLDFALLLPEDSESFSERAKSLVYWVEGFLTALKQSTTLKKSLPKESQEAIADFFEISQLDYDDDTKKSSRKKTDENEMNLSELIEYVRMGVLMIFQDSQHLAQPFSNPGNDQLH